jgi:hypothetical protein
MNNDPSMEETKKSSQKPVKKGCRCFSALAVFFGITFVAAAILIRQYYK